MAIGLKVANQDSVKNVRAAQSLDLENIREIRPVIYHFTENLHQAKIDILPLPNGTSVLRVTAKPISGEKMLKAHIEINLTGNELIDFMHQETFYERLASLKLNQYTGYMGEHYLMGFAKNGTLHERMFMKTAGREKAQSFFQVMRKQVVPDRVWAIQNGSGHGIDFLCEVQPYPPKPKYLTIDAKSTLRARFGEYSTPNGPPLSDKQQDALENLRTHLTRAVADFRDGNSYNLTRDEFRNFQAILSDIRSDATLLENYKANIGLTNGFNLASNEKYATMIVLSRIE